jgi:hypothetical protein
MRIGLIPLDERPIHNRFPALVAAGAGAVLVRPPIHLLSQRRRPGNSEALAEWLHQTAPSLDGLIVSCDQLGYGGMIAARTNHLPPAAVLDRLETLRRLRVAHPQLPIFGFSHIMRMSPGSDLIEEPSYWAEFGSSLYRYSLLLEAEHSGTATAAEQLEMQQLTAHIPAQVRRDMLVRRLRNQTVNQALLHMLSDEIFDVLTISVDDRQDGSLADRERRWLTEWAALVTDRPQLSVYPAGEELGAVLVARMLLWLQRRSARVAVRTTDGAALPAALQLMIDQQLQALGLQPAAADSTDLQLLLHLSPADAVHGTADAAPAAGLLSGQPLALADLAAGEPGGSAWIRSVGNRQDLRQLGGYCGWGYSGATIGCSLAQSVSRLLGPAAAAADRERMVLSRLIEDVGYRGLVRPDLLHWLQQRHQSHEPPNGAVQAQYCQLAEQSLNTFIGQLHGFAEQFEIAPASLYLPWRRTAEIDFTLRERTGVHISESIDSVIGC